MRASYRGRFPAALQALSLHPEVDLGLLMPEGDTVLLLTLSYHLKQYHMGIRNQDDLDPQPVVILLLDQPVVQGLAHTPNKDGWAPMMPPVWSFCRRRAVVGAP